LTQQSKTTVKDLKRTDAKEASIVEAAQRIFLARGYESASMDAIALEANVSKRTVYNRFVSKEDLFAATIEETCRRILPINVEDIEASLEPRAFVENMARVFVRGILSSEAIALRRIATFEAMRAPTIGAAYLEHGPQFMVGMYAPILARNAKRLGVEIGDPVDATWRLGALITEPLYTRVLLGAAPVDLDAAINRQIASGLDAFWKIYAQ
jgi:TetR/AcrR family transcriptional repressor of mexJK operon